MGLANLLLGINDFDALHELALRGDSSNVDLLVKDIYGPSNTKIHGLEGDIIATSFGKAACDTKGVKRIDTFRALPSDSTHDIANDYKYNFGYFFFSSIGLRILPGA